MQLLEGRDGEPERCALYLQTIEQGQDVDQRRLLTGQVLPQGFWGGEARGRAGRGVSLKGSGAGEAVDGAVGQEAGRSRFLQQGTLRE